VVDWWNAALAQSTWTRQWGDYTADDNGLMQWARPFSISGSGTLMHFKNDLVVDGGNCVCSVSISVMTMGRTDQLVV